MHLTVYEQSEIFRYAFLFGVGLGVFYDIFRFLRALGFCSKRAVFCQDVVFMSGCALLCFMFAQTTVHGHLRVYIMAAHLCGLLAYRFSVGIVTGYLFKAAALVIRSVFKVSDRIVSAVGAILCKLSANLSMNFRKIRHGAARKRKIEKNFS